MARRQRPTAPSPRQENTVRIIGGQWRGRKLPFPTIDGLRPTGDRIRETLFNWLQADLPGAHCLDAFAGAGALGFEALSREVASATLLDSSPKVTEQLKTNAKLLQANNATILCSDSLGWLKQPATQAFDIIFLDPPFAADLLQETAELLEANHWLSDNAAIYVEHPKAQQPIFPTTWQLHRNKAAGDVIYQLYYR
ncbi:MAG: 16S rRNA (guanine(966)-N(2))-methyltransferase RsmD [Cellvibrionaceae bacterium]